MKQKEIAPVCGTTGSFKLPIILGGSSNANVSNMGNFEGFPLQYCLSWVGNIMISGGNLNDWNRSSVVERKYCCFAKQGSPVAAL